MPYTSRYSKVRISRNVDDEKYFTYSEIPTLKAYSHYLMMKGQFLGLTVVDGHKLSAEEMELQKEIRQTCDSVEKALLNCSAGDIGYLTDFYTSLYIIGYHKLPDASIRGKQTDRLLRFWKNGDKTIEESDVYGMLYDLAPYSIRGMTTNPLPVINNLREGWVKILKTYNTFPETSTCERYKRLALIMRDNVDSYFSEDCSAAKETWYNKNKIAEYSTIGTKILTAYRLFVCSLYPAVLNSIEMTKLNVAVLHELISRPDLCDYDRQAYQLALAFETRN